jgi:F0F1-type ATP synthase assembly protein I
MSNQEKINEINAKLNTTNYVVSGLSLAGGVLGVMLAARRGNGFWGRVGYFFAGSILVGVAAGIATAPKSAKLIAERQNLEYQQGQQQSGQPTA